MMTSPLLETLEHRVFESQVRDQENSDLGSSKGSRAFDEVLSRFMNLTEEEQEIIQIVSRQEGLDAKTIGQKVGLSRYQALQKTKKLTDRHILRFTSGTKPTSGAKATFYFFLADDLSSGVVELILNSTALLKPEKVMQASPISNNIRVNTGDTRMRQQTEREANGAAQAASEPSVAKSRSINFWTKPPFSNVMSLVLQEPNGITTKEIEALTGSKKQTLHGWLKELLAAGQIKREKALGTSRLEYRYYPATTSFETVIPFERTEIKLENQELNSIPMTEGVLSVSENDEAHQTGQAVPESLSQQILPELPLIQVGEEIDIREILEALVDRVCDLENRFQSIEQALKGKKTVKSEKIQAFLKRE